MTTTTGSVFPMRYSIALLVFMASCCISPSEPEDFEPKFEQQVVGIDRGITVDQVVAILGPADSTESTPGGGEVWLWSRRSIRFRVHDPRLSCSTVLTAKVSFRKGAVMFVVLDYRLV